MSCGARVDESGRVEIYSLADLAHRGLLRIRFVSGGGESDFGGKLDWIFPAWPGRPRGLLIFQVDKCSKDKWRVYVCLAIPECYYEQTCLLLLECLQIYFWVVICIVYLSVYANDISFLHD